MATNPLHDFLREAIEQVPAIRRSIDGGEAIEATRSRLSAIARTAESLGQAEIASHARVLGTMVESHQPGSSLDTISALLTRLEAALVRESISVDEFSLDLLDERPAAAPVAEDPINFEFDLADYPQAKNDTIDLDQFFTNEPQPATERDSTIELRSEEPEIDASREDDAIDEFEVDPELLEIFAEEAEELLRNIDVSLENLSNDPNDSDSLWEIRRNAHTFKGSAGIVGLKQLSELAHRVEDLLDRMAEIKCGSNERVIELLHSATQCLKALVQGETSASLFQSISQLYYDFDSVLATLKDPAPTSVAEPLKDAPSIAKIAEPAVKKPKVARSAPLDSSIIERLFGPEKIEPAPAKAQPSRSVVRVSLDRLDDLVRVVRDMLISRSVFEQNLKSLERQIDDLHNATRRLQTTSTKLEIDFEASMMGSGSSFLPSSGLPALGSGQGSFDELEFDKYTEFHQSTRELAETTSDAFSINSSLDLLRGGFESVLDEQRRLFDELQQWLLHVRMVEFGALTTRLQRAVRVTCEEEGKKAELRVVNQSLQVDTQILDSLIEPLIHLIKNAVAHGIEDPETRIREGKPETGLIEVAVENDETHIVLTVSDDGRGIPANAVKEKAIALGELTPERAAEMSDEEALELIFLQGLSTAEKLNLSAGRGVGMSIIKESISSGRGSISIDSTDQRGTRFVIRMPLALAVTKVLLVRVSERTYALPLRPITHIAELTEDLFVGIDGSKVDMLGSKLPLHQLSAFLGNEPVQPAELLGKMAIVYESGDRSCAIAVEEVVTSEEIVIKPLAKPLDRIKGILGGAILGNGELVPVIDMPALLRKKVSARKPAVKPSSKPAITVMIVDDSPSVRHMTSKVVQSAGWQAKTAKDGLDALEQLKASDELPVVILSDIEMPRMDGYEFAASLHSNERFNKIPVVMITSRTADKHREKAMENGVSQYLTKPYQDRELIDSIKVLANLT